MLHMLAARVSAGARNWRLLNGIDVVCVCVASAHKTTQPIGGCPGPQLRASSMMRAIDQARCRVDAGNPPTNDQE
jgi:hypothetical protein